MQIINNNGKIGQQINIKTNDTPLDLTDKIANQTVITKTVTYEIEPSGDCGKCKSRHANTCWCFGDSVYSLIQLQSCKDYLAEHKSKVYCDGCEYETNYCEPGARMSCNLQNERSNYLDLNGEEKWYSLNCQDRSE